MNTRKSMLYGMMLSLVTLFLVGACGDDKDDATPAAEITSFNITAPEARTGIIDATTKSVSFQPLTPKTPLNEVVVEIGTPSGVTVSPASGSTVDFSNGPVTFVVTSGGTSVNYTATVTAEFAPTIAFVGAPAASGSITEVDTKAAWEYLSSEYGDTIKYIPFSSINSDALKYIDVVFYYTDAEPGSEPDQLAIIPDAAKNETVVSAFKNWHAQGGDFVLAGLATQYLNQLGRIPADGSKPFNENGWAPRIYGSGAGTDDLNPDQWGVNADLNVNALPTVSATDWNRTVHPIYAGLEQSDISNPSTGGTYNNPIFILVGDGAKEDHNSMWDINAAPIANFEDAFDKADQWEAMMEAKVLGTWGHVVDLCCGAVVELNPRAAAPNEGTIIAIGAAAYDWDQVREGGNPWVHNVETLTVNAIEYVRSK